MITFTAEAETREDLAYELERIAKALREGYTSGEGWDSTEDD